VTPVQRRTLVSAAVAVAAGAAIAGLFQRQERQYRNNEALVTVLTARAYIAQGRPVTAEMVVERQVPKRFAEPKALASLPAGGAPLRARIGLLKGEQVTAAHVTSDADRLGLAWSMPAGRRAVTLRLAVDQAGGPLVQPGDHVDVFSADRRGARSLVTDVPVAAIGDRTSAAVAEATEVISKSLADEGVLLTLLLKPDQALALTQARADGRIWIALRSALDGTGEESDEWKSARTPLSN
jgi:Flp pilus assembly protein CpaB